MQPYKSLFRESGLRNPRIVHEIKDFMRRAPFYKATTLGDLYIDKNRKIHINIYPFLVRDINARQRVLLPKKEAEKRINELKNLLKNEFSDRVESIRFSKELGGDLVLTLKNPESVNPTI